MSSPDEIAAALTKLYKLFIKMGYLTDADISWPPHTQHPLDISRLQELQFDQSAIDLLQKIPWALTGSNLDTGFSLIVNYSDSEDLDSTRDPTNYMVDDPEEPQHLDGFVFPLNFINPRSGTCLLVDVRDGMFAFYYHHDGLKRVLILKYRYDSKARSIWTCARG